MNDLLDSNLIETFETPKWLKYFSILFAIIGSMIPIIILLNVINYRPQMAVYGFESNTIFNITGIIILLIYSIKAIVSYGILRRKKWAFSIAVSDAIIGIAACVLNFGLLDLLVNNSHINFQIRLELLILAPYIMYLLKNNSNWQKQFD